MLQPSFFPANADDDSKYWQSWTYSLADLIGHQGPVFEVAWAHPKFGNILASCGFDNQIIFWQEQDSNQWSPVNSFINHLLWTSESACLAKWSFPYNHRRSCSSSRATEWLNWLPEMWYKTLDIWLGAWLQAYTSQLHTASVNSLSFAPHEVGLILASASSDGSIGIISMAADGTFQEERVCFQSRWASMCGWGIERSVVLHNACGTPFCIHCLVYPISSLPSKRARLWNSEEGGLLVTL